MKKKSRGLSKIMRTLCGLAFVAAIDLIVVTGALGDGIFNKWFFTAESIEAAYRYQEDYGERLRNPLRAKECLFGSAEFVASYRGGEFTVPCRFVTETVRHFKEMIVAGAARYLFPLDANHGHLGIPIATWEKYKYLPPDRVMQKILRDPSLIVLYHTAEHVQIPDARDDALHGDVKSWIDKRNVLGFFNGRPNKILTPDPRGYGVAMPDGYWPYSGFEFLASPMGELFAFVANKTITFDIALEDDNAETWGFSRSADNGSKLVRTSSAASSGGSSSPEQFRKGERK
jgi:hypothetical protein